MLRAALATKMDYRVATHTASLIGQGMAFLFANCGLLNGLWTLPLVAVFVFMAVRQEVQHVMERALNLCIDRFSRDRGGGRGVLNF